MNPGELRNRLAVMTLRGDANNVYAWAPSRETWGKVKYTGKIAVFAKTGVGASGAEILMRKSDITPYQMIKAGGEMFFITSIIPEGIHPIYHKISCALVEPVEATVTRTESGMSKEGYPENTEKEIITLPVVLTEKYLRESDTDSHAENTRRLIAVTPREYKPEAGDRMEIGGETYRVEVIHDLNRYTYEVEIERVSDD
jgi:hypothetical protein